MFDKVERMEADRRFLAAHVPGADAERASRAALLAKADLSTGMVGEFPELQGIMGRYYALHDGEDPADRRRDRRSLQAARAERHLPDGARQLVVALADKLDPLTGFFAIDEKPTGSRDPFALRRAALGIIRIILENRLRLPLKAVFAEAHLALRAQQRADEIGIPGSGGGWTRRRCPICCRSSPTGSRCICVKKAVRHDLIAAVFALTEEDDLVRLLARVDALANFLGSEDGANSADCLSPRREHRRDRAAQGGLDHHGAVDADLLRLDAEPATSPRGWTRRNSRARRHARTRGFRAGNGGSGILAPAG